MRKKLNFICILTCIFFQATSQNWDSLPGSKIQYNQVRVLYADTVDNYMYMAGFFAIVNGQHIKGIARWNGLEWDSLGAGIDGMDNNALANALCITRYNNELYVGGAFYSLGDRKAVSIGKWDGNSWDSLAVQPFRTNLNNVVYALEVINNELYVGGIFDTVAGVPVKGIAKWNGTNWSSLNFNLQNNYGINCIAYYNNEIYVAGNFYDQLPTDGTRNIMKYDGVSWTKVGTGVNGDHIASMAVYNNELYVAGLFLSAQGNKGNYIQKWNGTVWSDAGGGLAGANNDPFDNAQVQQLLVYQNKIYAVGAMRYAGVVPAQYISIWDGTNWCGLGSDFDNRIGTLCFYKDTLYVGGGFWTIDGDSIDNVAKWNGGNYTDTCGNLTGIENTHNKSALNIYPNPNNGLFTIEAAFEKSEEISIMLYNMMGECVLKIEGVIVNESYKKQLNIEKFPAGVYFLSIQTSAESVQLKVVKQ